LHRIKVQFSDLIKQGVQLNDQGKYTEAIDKYNEALKLEPENAQANYEMAFHFCHQAKEMTASRMWRKQ